MAQVSTSVLIVTVRSILLYKPCQQGQYFRTIRCYHVRDSVLTVTYRSVLAGVLTVTTGPYFRTYRYLPVRTSALTVNTRSVNTVLTYQIHSCCFHLVRSCFHSVRRCHFVSWWDHAFCPSPSPGLSDLHSPCPLVLTQRLPVNCTVSDKKHLLTAYSGRFSEAGLPDSECPL